jgi:hypothetical protein
MPCVGSCRRPSANNNNNNNGSPRRKASVANRVRAAASALVPKRIRNARAAKARFNAEVERRLAARRAARDAARGARAAAHSVATPNSLHNLINALHMNHFILARLNSPLKLSVKPTNRTRNQVNANRQQKVNRIINMLNTVNLNQAEFLVRHARVKAQERNFANFNRILNAIQTRQAS